MIYQGPTTTLIRLPNDATAVQASRLASLSREYACAESYTSTARGTLVPGHVPDGYSLMTLFRKPEDSTQNGITTFKCIYYGVMESGDYENPYVVRGSIIKSASYSWKATIGEATGDYSRTWKYLAPTLTRTFVVEKDAAVTLDAPTLSELLNGETIVGFEGLETSSLSTSGASATYEFTPGELTDLVVSTSVFNRQNFGEVDEITQGFEVSAIPGL